MTVSAEVHLLSGSWFAIYIVQYNCNWLYLINLKIFICARAWGRGLCIIRTMNLDCNVHVNYLTNCFTSHTEPTHETSMVTYLGAQTILFAYKERSNKLLRIPSSCSPCNASLKALFACLERGIFSCENELIPVKFLRSRQAYSLRINVLTHENC